MPQVQSTGGGFDTYRRLSTADVNAAVAKAGPGLLFDIIVSNTNAAGRYLKLYDKLAAPTVGTDTPIMTIFCPPGQTISVDVGGDRGLRFANGLGIGITVLGTDADATAVAAGEIIIHLLYR